MYLRRPRGSLPFPLEEPGCRVVAWGRHGVWSGAQRIGLKAGDVVLVPAYHHGSEIEALLQAGLECRFYEARPSLEPDAQELEGLIDERVKALHLTHVLGFPQDAPRWRAFCDERGLKLVEDCAQAWLAERDGVPVGATGDLAVFCLYKTFGLSEGAAVLARPPTDPVALDPRIGAYELAVRNVRWLASRSGAVYRVGRALRRRLPAARPDPIREFELRDPAAGPWRHTWFVLRRIADPAAASRRRENYARLARHLGELIPPPFDQPLAGASPFAFPVRISDKARVAAALGAQGIGHFPFWEQPHPALPVQEFPEAAARRGSTIALPVHQELRGRDLDRIARVVAGASG